MTRQQGRNADWNPELIDGKRNPYLAERRSGRRISQAQRHNGSGISQAERRSVRSISQAQRHSGDGMHKTQRHNGDGISQARRYSRNRKARRRARARRRICVVLAACAFFAVALMVRLILSAFDKPDVDGSMVPAENEARVIDNMLSGEKVQGISVEDYNRHPAWTENFLTPNEYSRPGDPLKKVKNIFVHYTANQGTSAAQNRSYFEQLKDTRERSASAHFIIGYEGEILQCVPLDEIAYAVQTRNEDSISIECCYVSDDGSFTQETYDSLIQLLQWLIDTYDLETEDILRHYDCGGKKCPIYYTEHEDAWEELKKDIS